MIWLDVDTAVEMMVNAVQLTSDSDFVTKDETIAYNEAGMDLYWNFVTTGGTVSCTAVTPTTAGNYDWAHVDGAMYKIEMPASGGASANNDTEGFGWWSGKADGVLAFASPIYGFRAAATNNSLVDGTTIDVNVTALSGDSTAADNAESFFDGTGYAGTGNTIPTVTTLTGHTAQTGDSYARLGAPAGASIAADIATVDTVVDSILVDTAEIGAAGAGLTAVPWNASWDAEVQSEANDALVAIGLDHLVGASVTGTDVVDNSIIARMVASGATADWDTFVNTTDSLQAIRDHVGDGTNLTEAGGTGDHLTSVPWNASWDAEVQSEVNDALVALGLDHLVSAAVVGADVTDNSIVAKMVASGATADWDTFVNTTDSLQATRDHIGDGSNLTEAGGTGDHLNAVPWNATWDAEVQSEVNDGLVALGLDHLVSASVVGADVTDNSIIAYMVSKSATADWDSFVNTSDALEALSDMIGATPPTAAQIADAVWDEAQADHVAAGSFGETATEIASILVDTAEIGTAGAGLTDLGGMSTAMKAEVNTEAGDVINTDTYTEIAAGAPSDTPTLSAMIRELYFAYKNKKTVTSSTLTLRNSADSATLHTATLGDDGTTFTKGEISA